MNDHARMVHAVTASARAFCAPRWLEWRRNLGRPLDEGVGGPALGMCRFSSVFLAAVLSQHTGNRWVVVGGTPQPAAGAHPSDRRFHGLVDRHDGGIRDQGGVWHGHYWATDAAAGLLADITADQFGWAPVLVLDAGDSRFRANYTHTAIAEHVRAATTTPARWLQEWSAAIPAPPAAGLSWSP